MKSLCRKLRYLVTRRSREADLLAELEFHLEEEAERCQSEGASPLAAHRAARLDLGNATLLRENTRAVWGWPLLAFFEQLVQDLRYAFRTMRANRLFALLAVTSLGLGIGANTAIYSFMDAILLRSLPVRDPGSLVAFEWHARSSSRDFVMHSMSGTTYEDPGGGETAGIFPYPAYQMFRRQNHNIFTSVFAHFHSWQVRNLNVAVCGQAVIAAGECVSGDFFAALGVPPAAGRLIVEGDDQPGAPAVAVASSSFAQSRFGGPAQAAGQSILIDNLPFTVVGVAPPEFFGVDPSLQPDLYLPIHTNELLGAGLLFGFRPERYLGSNDYWVQVMGRLRPGVTLAQAQAVLGPRFHQWVASTAIGRELDNLPELAVREGAGGIDTLRRRYSQPLYVLMAMVGLILLLACANVANLLLARATARRREIALRLSVGAGRGRIIRQLLTESVLLASIGGILGVLLAFWGIRALTMLLANGAAGFTLRANLNGHVLLVACGLSLLTGIVFGLIPALQATRVDVIPALKETRAGRGDFSPAHRMFNASRMLIASQVAISLILLVAAGLFVRTLTNLHSINLGFNRENILLFRLDARKAGHRDPEIAAFYGTLREQFLRIPGVRQASLSEDSLIEAGTGLLLGEAGKPANDDNRILSVGPSFFTTMQIPIVAGREIEERDGAGAPAVVVINQAFAKNSFPGQNPLGRHLTLRASGEAHQIMRDMEIVGVAGDARYGGLTRKIPPVAFLPYNQGYPRPDQMVYALRTVADPLAYVNSVREIVRRADARVPVYEVRTQSADINRTINQEITFATLCTGFAVLALVMACVGLYGTVSYNVSRRTGEIGIRMALGARPPIVVRMVLREVIATTGWGLLIGMAVALSASRFVASFLYGIKSNDPWALALALITLLAAALLAGYVPARRASRIDPMAALRHE